MQSPFGVNGGNCFIDVLTAIRLYCCSVTGDHCIFDHRLKNPFVLHVALMYFTPSTKSAVVLCAFGKVSFAGRLGFRGNPCHSGLCCCFIPSVPCSSSSPFSQPLQKEEKTPKSSLTEYPPTPPLPNCNSRS